MYPAWGKTRITHPPRKLTVIHRSTEYTVVRCPKGVHVCDLSDPTTKFIPNGPDADKVEVYFRNLELTPRGNAGSRAIQNIHRRRRFYNNE